jgi:1-acyl-sn-glycerol-3-phosphate acyltransferase
MEPVYLPVIGIARTLFKIQGLKFSYTGQENVPLTGGAVLAMNHIGYMDFTYAGLPCRDAKRLVRFMAKDDVFKHKISGPLMRGMKHISVDRTAGAASYRAAVEALKSGEIVGVFPEATISRAFDLKEFKTGAVRMAAAADVPVLPMIIWGSQRVWTKDHPKNMRRPKVPIHISIGKPLYVAKGANAEAETERLRAQMTEMLHTVQENYPPMTGDDLIYVPARMGGKAPTLEEAMRMDQEELAERAAKRAAKQAAKQAAKGK